MDDVTKKDQSHREKKKSETRRAIRRAAIGLFKLKGEKFTVSEIAASVGITSRTFFNYFDSKEAAVLGIDHDMEHQLAVMMHGRPAGESVIDSLGAVLEQMMLLRNEGRTEDTDWYLLASGTRSNLSSVGGFLMVNKKLQGILVPIVAERCGMTTDDLYPHMVVATCFAAIASASIWQANTNGATSHSDAIAMALQELKSGLRSALR